MDKRKWAALLLMEDEEDAEIVRIITRKRSKRNQIFETRREEGFFNLLISRHLQHDDEKFRQFFRLNKEQFYFILSFVNNDIKKSSTNAVRNPISPEEKLAVTLRYMATGESFRSLAFAFRVSHCCIGVIVKETLAALRSRLVEQFIPTPTQESLKQNAKDFWIKWNFPNCLSAIDGKHIRIVCPNKSGSLFFNYKEYFSIVLLGMVDANYMFTAVDIGSYGKEGDSGIFAKSNMGKLVKSGNIFPADATLPGSNKTLPHVIIGDEAFQLQRHVMKPYTKAAANSNRAKAIFNYRLSRARRVTENAFGLLSQVFRVFYTPIAISPLTCDDLILSACCLHNFLRSGYLERNNITFFHFDKAALPPTGLHGIRRPGGFANQEGFHIREQLTHFFNEEGATDWQDHHVTRLSSV